MVLEVKTYYKHCEKGCMEVEGQQIEMLITDEKLKFKHHFKKCSAASSYLSIYLSIYVSIYVSIYLSIYLSIYIGASKMVQNASVLYILTCKCAWRHSGVPFLDNFLGIRTSKSGPNSIFWTF